MPGKFDKRLGEFRDKDSGDIMYIGTSNIVDLYVSNETELLAAWDFFINQNKSVRAWQNGNIVLTNHRQFIVSNATNLLKTFELRGIGIRPIDLGTFTFTTSRIYFENITFLRKNAISFILAYEGQFVGDNIHFRYYNNVGTIANPVANIEITGAYYNGTGGIKLRNISHASGDNANNNLTGNIQPFIILNNATGAALPGANVYIDINQVQSLSNFDCFSRVLLKSNTNVKYMVTGDESWYHDAAQLYPPNGFMIAESKILKVSSADEFLFSTSATKLRMTTRNDAICFDRTITSTGFSGVEDIDWENIQTIN
jgi:hypothetical protein